MEVLHKKMKTSKADILEILPKLQGSEEEERGLERQITEESVEDIFKAFYKKERGVDVEEEVLQVLMSILNEEENDETH